MSERDKYEIITPLNNPLAYIKMTGEGYSKDSLKFLSQLIYNYYVDVSMANLILHGRIHIAVGYHKKLGGQLPKGGKFHRDLCLV